MDGFTISDEENNDKNTKIIEEIDFNSVFIPIPSPSSRTKYLINISHFIK
jgi:hypothetical protein